MDQQSTPNKIMMTRRQAIKTTALASAAIATIPVAFAQQGGGLRPEMPMPRDLIDTAPAPFTLPPLPYDYDALEPFIDTETMHIHHDKHHAAYIANLNKAVAQFPDQGNKSVEDLLKNLDTVPEKIRTAVRNNGGGHYNHSLFWQMMKPGGGGEPSGDLAKAIDSNFGNFSTFKETFSKTALGQFGSGWAWLVLVGGTLKIQARGDKGTLKIEASPNQDTPLSSGQTPLLGLDVWEHAYYLKHQNKRVDYIAAWWNVTNWDFVASRFNPGSRPLAA
jgi:Fe-Mn family superoxide dismutase